MLATLTAYCSLWPPRHQHHRYDVVGASALPSRQHMGTILHRRPTTRPCQQIIPCRRHNNLMSTTTPSTIHSLHHRADSTPSYSTTRLHLHDIPYSDCVPSSSSVITLPRIRRCTSRDAASIIRNCSANDALLIITCDASGRGVS